jgi:hypothetical protein
MNFSILNGDCGVKYELENFSSHDDRIYRTIQAKADYLIIISIKKNLYKFFANF